MADLVVKADGTFVKKETSGVTSLPLKEHSTSDRSNSRNSESYSNRLSTINIPNNIGMSDFVKLLNEFSNTLISVKESINTLTEEIKTSNESLLELRRDINSLKHNAVSSVDNYKTALCYSGEETNKNICGSAIHKHVEIEITIDLKSSEDICLFNTSFAKIDTSLILSLEIDSKVVNGKLIEKDNKYYLSFPKLDKYSDSPLEFTLPII